MLGNPSSLCPLGQGMRANPMDCQRTGARRDWCCAPGVKGRAARCAHGPLCRPCPIRCNPRAIRPPCIITMGYDAPRVGCPRLWQYQHTFLPQCVIFATVSILPPPWASRPQPELRPSRNTPTGWPSPGSVAEQTPWGSPHGRAPSQQVSSLTHVSEKTLGAKSSPGADGAGASRPNRCSQLRATFPGPELRPGTETGLFRICLTFHPDFGIIGKWESYAPGAALPTGEP